MLDRASGFRWAWRRRKEAGHLTGLFFHYMLPFTTISQTEGLFRPWAVAWQSIRISYRIVRLLLPVSLEDPQVGIIDSITSRVRLMIEVGTRIEIGISNLGLPTGLEYEQVRIVH